MKIIVVISLAMFIVAGSFLTSCHYNPVVVHNCDTCNLNQDSLQKVRDSLAHAFTWTEYVGDISGEADIAGCWIFGENDIYIVGHDVYHFDGNKFTSLNLHYSDKPTIHVNSVDYNLFAFSKTDFWMVNAGDILHGDGVHCTLYQPAGSTNSCWGTSSNDMFFVGNGGLIYHYDGTKFDSMISNTSEDLQSVWGTNSTDVWASGFNYSTGGTVIEHYDGISWSVDNLTNTSAKINGFEAVWTCDSSSHKFVITSGAFAYRKTDNGNWREDLTIPNSLGGGTDVGLYLLRGNSADDIMASGSWGWVGHWNGKTWKKYDQLYDYNNGDYISKALSVNGNIACVVGVKGGASWVLVGHRN
jgi:hypothetical protein